MLNQTLLLGTSIVVICVAFHVAGLAYSIPLLKKAGQLESRLGTRATIMLIVVTGVLVVIFLHTAELWLWAVIYMGLGEFQQFEEALYFSAVTATTLGYGDVIMSDKWRLLAPFEAMGGLILFAASTAYLLQLVNRLFTVFNDAD